MKLVAVDTDQPGGFIVLACLHCHDGTVAIEEDITVENTFSIVVAPSLKRNEMTPAEKREHLRGLGIKDSADIEKIIADIYKKGPAA